MRLNGLMNSVSFAPVWAPEGAGDGAGDGTVTPPESVLFPDDKAGEGEGAGDDKGGDKGEGAGDQGAADWKEYENDPAKSAEENAAAKAEHDKTKPAAGDDKNKNADADKVPADGKYALTMPDGVELDTDLADALGPEFKSLNLTNAQAQKLVDKYIEVQTKRATDSAGKPETQWSAAAYNYFKDNGTPDTWADKAKADPEIGGGKWDASVASATRAIAALGDADLKNYLNASGGGNHPSLIRFMAKVGSMIKEDNPANGGAEGAGKPVEAAHVLFPNDAPKG